MLQITVRSSAGSVVLSRMSFPFEPIMRLKQDIFKKEGTPVICQQLVWENKILDDAGQTFAQAGLFESLGNAAEITLVRQPLSVPQHIFWVGEVLVVIDGSMPCEALDRVVECESMLEDCSYPTFVPHRGPVYDAMQEAMRRCENAIRVQSDWDTIRYFRESHVARKQKPLHYGICPMSITIAGKQKFVVGCQVVHDEQICDILGVSHVAERHCPNGVRAAHLGATLCAILNGVQPLPSVAQVLLPLSEQLNNLEN